MFTLVIIRKRKNGRMDVRLTDGLMDDQRETIISRHYCVAGYKNVEERGAGPVQSPGVP